MTRLLKIATVAAASLLMILMFRSQPAKAADTYYQVASIHKTTSTSWRGNWYSYVNGRFCLTQINQYSVTQKYKGKKHTLYKSSWKGYRKLAVGKIIGTNRYTFNAYAKKPIKVTTAGESPTEKLRAKRSPFFEIIPAVGPTLTYSGHLFIVLTAVIKGVYHDKESNR